MVFLYRILVSVRTHLDCQKKSPTEVGEKSVGIGPYVLEHNENPTGVRDDTVTWHYTKEER